MRLSNGRLDTIADGFNVPLTGVNYRNGDIYVSHKGVITVLKSDGTRLDIISGLPSYGDFSNNQVTFSQDGKMYFGQGTATNSGVVGLDKKWIFEYPFFNDFPGSYILLNGINFETKDVLIPMGNNILTGAFAPFGIPNLQRYEVIRAGIIKATGSILRSNPNGSNLEMVAWGFRNPIQMKFDVYNRLIISNQGFENRGSRPIANAPDELHVLKTGAWYGWPDYSGGELVALPKFRPEGGPTPELLLANIPAVPEMPIATFPSGSNIMGFDFNYNRNFGPVGEIYIASFGETRVDESRETIRLGVGHRISRVNINDGLVSTFAINKSGYPQEEGFGRLTDVVFGSDGAMYVLDFAIADINDLDTYLSNTGVIWKITRI